MRRITPGVILRLDSVKHYYAPQEQLNANILLVNESDPTDFIIYSSSYPPYQWAVSMANSDSLIAYTSAFFPAIYQDTLRIGDTTKFTITWTQKYTDLPNTYAPPGKYKFTVYMRGHALFLPVYKHFEITQ
ncbi:MAG: hypothetical protein HBSIN02_25300 [Bacteroidia bacterium]|nr:MAG: hypothetical protein HBSIN02_25300 [Bacteroidia bacterium]